MYKGIEKMPRVQCPFTSQIDATRGVQKHMRIILQHVAMFSSNAIMTFPASPHLFGCILQIKDEEEFKRNHENQANPNQKTIILRHSGSLRSRKLEFRKYLKAPAVHSDADKYVVFTTV